MRSCETPIAVFEEFLSASELFALHTFAAAHEGHFVASTVVTNDGHVLEDRTSRRSLVLNDVGTFRDLFAQRIGQFLPLILYRLHLPMFQTTTFEIQLTASNHGEFFVAHTDSGGDSLSTRAVTFVYYCHREPRRFQGGELQIYGRDPISGQDLVNVCHTVQPSQNTIVFFPSERLHEIRQICCASRAFADSRFTLNGWLNR
jgi:SM-20-related protein